MSTHNIQFNNVDHYKLFSQQINFLMQKNLPIFKLSFDDNLEIATLESQENQAVSELISQQQIYYKDAYLQIFQTLISIQENFLKSQNLLNNHTINTDFIHHIVQNFKNNYVSKLLNLTLDQEKLIFQATEQLANVLGNYATVPTLGSINLSKCFADISKNPFDISILLDRPIELNYLGIDVASLVKDYHLGWEEDVRLDLAIEYWQLARKSEILNEYIPQDIADFYKAVEFCGVLNHLEQLGALNTLSQASSVNHQAQLAPKIELLKHYLHETTKRYSELTAFFALFAKLHNLTIETAYTF